MFLRELFKMLSPGSKVTFLALERERARRRQRLASETAAEREKRLSQRRARDRARRAARSSPTSETRLVQMGSVERLYLQHGENYLNLSAFDDVLRDISCSSDVTPSTLLKAKPFTLSYVCKQHHCLS